MNHCQQSGVRNRYFLFNWLLYKDRMKWHGIYVRKLFECSKMRTGTSSSLLVSRMEYTVSIQYTALDPGVQCATQTIVLELVGHLWDVILSDAETEDEIRSIIREPLFAAAKVGNSEFLAQLMPTYHQADLMWEIVEEDRSIIHFAVLNRHAQIFNLIHKLGAIIDVLVTFEDAEGNNLLHYAAKLAPPEQLNSISGAAFQMMHELIWFEKVKKDHEELLEKAKSWMERTANSCMLVSTVIATGVLSVAFSIPGGDNDDGIPHYFKKPAFLIFAVSDATALISTST
ncbi:hypothetical protein L6164_017143 [Bauhinia variegata]|uniref:Uncharacterized protein n=1 Tax=Bauhinia variegata TaxID=167791 RepID=A0ACB9N899_BAUVA|nr:hypothetical protein L6164_017143 [Bauhinia variegata]